MPDWFSLHHSEPPAGPPGTPVFRYRGAVGLVDRPYLLPAIDDATPAVVNLGPAKPCDEAAAEAALEAKLIFTGGNKPDVVTVAGAERCQQVEQAAAGVSLYRALGCARGAVVRQRRVDGYCWTELTLPHAPALGSLAHGIAPAPSGSMRIVVAAAADPIIEEAATKSCAELGSGFSGIACIDRLYVAKPGETGITATDVDFRVCEFHAEAENDFAKLCKKDSTSHPKKCQYLAGNDTIKLYADDCGNVRGLFYYQKLLTPKADPEKFFTRELRGATALPRFAGDTGSPIPIPGREYLASTDETGKGFEHKPKFNPLGDPVADPRELRLEGNADKKRSVLTWVPRRAASRVCRNVSPPEGCDGVDVGEEDFTCKDDRGVSGGQCDAPTGGPRYFVCDSGLNAGKPCTRTKHCPPSDVAPSPRCNGTPKCWDPATKMPTTTDCTTDSCTGTLECGEPLFDLRPRRDASKIVRLNRVPQGAERGVCDVPIGDTPTPTRCATNAECGAGVECVRYRLEAGDPVDE